MQKSKESNGNVQKTVYHGRGNATKSHKNKASSFSSRSVMWASEIFQAICIMVVGFPKKVHNYMYGKGKYRYSRWKYWRPEKRKEKKGFSLGITQFTASKSCATSSHSF